MTFSFISFFHSSCRVSVVFGLALRSDQAIMRVRGEFDECNFKQTHAEEGWLVFYSFILHATSSWSGLEDIVCGFFFFFFSRDLFLEG